MNNTEPDEYICEDCGHTVATGPVDRCPECGGKMESLGSIEKTIKAEAGEDGMLSDEEIAKIQDQDDSNYESLESLREAEEEDDQKSYYNDSYGDSH